MTLTLDRLYSVLLYNPETGEFSWKIRRPGTKATVGTIWNRPDRQRSTGYLQIYIDRTKYFAHRLAWLYVHGRWPVAEIDHINGDGLDNRLCNLREATRAQNSTNSPAQKSNKTGLRGVHYHWEAKRYRAQITKDGTRKHLGYFDTPQEAYDAYLSAAKVLHGEFVRDGTRVRSVAGAIAFRE